MGYHLLNLRGFLVAGLEILMYSVVQIYGFSYIYNMIPESCMRYTPGTWGSFLSSSSKSNMSFTSKILDKYITILTYCHSFIRKFEK